ncbi:MAG: sigma-70 family RNA polymerase sigma factor [Oscillospiraceae bacterium]|nr:sigma-70 family RNA polymerase sigma factor [Oscillospiraceae bacterium]
MKTRQPNPKNEANMTDLVNAVRNGDQQAFSKLYEATSQEVYRTARAILRSEDLALDVQQDTYVFAYDHLAQLSDPEKLRPWLRSIAVNRAKSVLRKQNPVLFTELETEEGESLPEQADLSPAVSPELSLERKETASLVNEILEGLSDGQRAAVGMYYYEQMTVGEIADALGVSQSTVKNQLARGRKKIEDAVYTLERKGIKLYGLSPMPFLLALLKRQSIPVQESEAVLVKRLTKAGLTAGAKAVAVSGGASAAVTTTEAVALHVGRSFFETVAGKLVLGLITAGVVVGSAAGYRWVKNGLHERNSNPVLQVTTSDSLMDDPNAPTVPVEIKITGPTLPIVLEVPTEAPVTEPTETTEPSTTETEPKESEEPQPPEPEAPGANPDENNSQPIEPGPAEPDVTEPGPSEPVLTEPEPTKPDATEPPHEEDVELYRAISNRILSDGRGAGYIPNDMYTKEMYDDYWGWVDEHWAYTVQCIYDYVHAVYATDAYAPFVGKETYAEVTANEGLKVAYAMYISGFGKLNDEGLFVGSYGWNSWNLVNSFPTLEDFISVTKTAYGNNPKSFYNKEATGNEGLSIVDYASYRFIEKYAEL